MEAGICLEQKIELRSEMERGNASLHAQQPQHGSHYFISLTHAAAASDRMVQDCAKLSELAGLALPAELTELVSCSFMT